MLCGQRCHVVENSIQFGAAMQYVYQFIDFAYRKQTFLPLWICLIATCVTSTHTDTANGTCIHSQTLKDLCQMAADQISCG